MKRKRKQLAYESERKTLIEMGNGIRAVNISSLTTGSMREEKTHRDIIKNLASNKIHISPIQETHITQDRDNHRDNYRVIAEAATEKENRSNTRRKSNRDT